jgi:hypothetical protein
MIGKLKWPSFSLFLQSFIFLLEGCFYLDSIDGDGLEIVDFSSILCKINNGKIDYAYYTCLEFIYYIY